MGAFDWQMAGKDRAGPKNTPAESGAGAAARPARARSKVSAVPSICRLWCDGE
jgi:hypothetical protein